jgi:hypothetical protein
MVGTNYLHPQGENDNEKKELITTNHTKYTNEKHKIRAIIFSTVPEALYYFFVFFVPFVVQYFFRRRPQSFDAGLTYLKEA